MSAKWVEEKVYLSPDQTAESPLKVIFQQKIFLFSRVTVEATNLFLKENGHEILKAMQPQLQKKLSSEFLGIGNTLLKNVPRNNFLKE